jgi:hypothetical protein
MRRIIPLLLLALVGATVAALTLGRMRAADSDLSQAPERRAVVPSVPEAPSSLQVRLILPTATLTEALGRAMPDSHRLAGRQRVCIDVTEKVREEVSRQLGGDLGRLLGDLAGEVARDAAGTKSGRLCQDIDYDVTIRRNGAPSVRSTGAALEVVLPIAVEGRAGFPGDLARSLGFDARNFRGAMDAIARVSADLTSDWCPRLTAEGDFRWTDRAQLEIVDGTWIDIDAPAGAELRRRIEQGVALFDESLTCDMVRGPVAAEWREIDTALPVPDAGEVAHLHFRPTGAGFSGIEYGTDSIAAALQIDGITEVRSGPPPGTSRRLDLPRLERIDGTANRVDINLPVRLGYDALTAELNRQLAGRTFTGGTPAGEARVTVEEVTLYPSGDRLAAGLRFTADFDRRLLDASGWAYLAARPVLAEDGRAIRLEDVALTRQVDNELWTLLSGIFNDQIAEQLARTADFPLDDAIATAQEQLAVALQDLEATSGIRISLDNPEIALTALVPAAEALEAVARFRTRAELTVLSLR